MNMQAAAMKMLADDRKAQADAGKRELVALSFAHLRAIHEPIEAAYSDTRPHVKKAAGVHAAAPVMRKLRTKKNRAERIAARNLAR
jgi:hypothetical protein